MKILHVNEAMAAGMVVMLDSLSRRQTEQGAEVTVHYLVRRDTPSAETIRNDYLPSVTLVRQAPRGKRLADFRELFRSTRATLASNEYDVIHVHCSIGGAIVRLARVGVRTRTKVFYSPHGFAFLRLNTSRLTRRLTLLAERLLSRVGDGLILTSHSEHDLAITQVKAPKTTFLKTGMRSETIATTPRTRVPGQRPVVGMIGRVSYQKAPWRFAEVAAQLADVADFHWVGSGTEEETREWIGDKPVQVSGWLSGDDLKKAVDAIDILLFPTLWEGMSLALMQAQSRGIPAVVSDVVGNRDSVLHGTSGFICQTDAQLLDYTRQLINDPALCDRFSAAALTWSHDALTEDNVGVDTIALYSGNWDAPVAGTPATVRR